MSDQTLLVVAYDEKSRKVLTESTEALGVQVISCDTFAAAESFLLNNPAQGIVVDLITMVKAKAEEKTIAFTLTTLFPTLRVRVLGPMLVPMTMSGETSQDKSLATFIEKTCSNFPLRKIRFHRRKEVNIPIAILSETCRPTRTVTTDISWGGAFLIDMDPDRFAEGSTIRVSFPEIEEPVEAVVIRIIAWGQMKVPGIGVKFTRTSPAFDEYLKRILHSDKSSHNDRLAA